MLRWFLYWMIIEWRPSDKGDSIGWALIIIWAAFLMLAPMLKVGQDWDGWGVFYRIGGTRTGWGNIKATRKGISESFPLGYGFWIIFSLSRTWQQHQLDLGNRTDRHWILDSS